MLVMTNYDKSYAGTVNGSSAFFFRIDESYA